MKKSEKLFAWLEGLLTMGLVYAIISVISVWRVEL